MKAHRYEVAAERNPALRLSADERFLGDGALHNPDDLLVISLSGCHLLSYLAGCARAGVRILSNEDAAEGTMA